MRTHSLLNEYKRVLPNAGIRVYEIKRTKLDDRSFDGIRVATMHRVKGLEFQHVFIVAANNRIIPLASAIADYDQTSKTESLTSEKCLLYCEFYVIFYHKSPSIFGFGGRPLLRFGFFREV